MNGTVSNVIPAKQYGFITGDDGNEYFFHKDEITCNWRDLADAFSLAGGGKIKVAFDAAKTPKGPRARSVSIIDAEE